MGITKRKNVFVIGAGASTDFNLPTGDELKKIISSELDIEVDKVNSVKALKGNETIAFAMEQLEHSNCNFGDLLEKALSISYNMHSAVSIDNYLDSHSDDAELIQIGKLAITSSISNAERGSPLYRLNNSKNVSHELLDDISNSWLGELFKILSEKRPYDEFIDALKNITFISFNYDRCIHQYFYHVANKFYRKEKGEHCKIVNALKIIYPYGSIGDFVMNSNGQTNYGEGLNVSDLIGRAKHLKTFTESVGANIGESIHSAFSEADVVMFLGFGYHRLNMKLLHGRNRYQVERVLGTVYAESKNSVEIVFSGLRGHFRNRKDGYLEPGKIQLKNLVCSKFISDFRRQLET